MPIYNQQRVSSRRWLQKPCQSRETKHICGDRAHSCVSMHECRESTWGGTRKPLWDFHSRVSLLNFWFRWKQKLMHFFLLPCTEYYKRPKLPCFCQLWIVPSETGLLTTYEAKQMTDRYVLLSITIVLIYHVCYLNVKWVVLWPNCSYSRGAGKYMGFFFYFFLLFLFMWVWCLFYLNLFWNEFSLALCSLD